MSTLETANNGYFIFQGSIRAAGSGATRNIGTSALDLVALLPIDSLELCQAINTILGLNGYLGMDWYFSSTTGYWDLYGKFRGSYLSVNSFVNDGGSWTTEPQYMGCLKQGFGGTAGFRPSGDVAPKNAPYFFYAVLLAR